MNNNPANPANVFVKLKSGTYMDLLTTSFISFKVKDLYTSNNERDHQAFGLLLNSVIENKQLEDNIDEDLKRRLLLLNPLNPNVQHVVWSMMEFDEYGNFKSLTGPLIDQ